MCETNYNINLNKYLVVFLFPKFVFCDYIVVLIEYETKSKEHNEKFK